MDKKEIKSGVIQCLIDNDYIDRDYNIVDSTSFAEDLAFDSLDRLEFAMQLENYFSIQILDDDLFNPEVKHATLADVCSYLEKILIND